MDGFTKSILTSAAPFQSLLNNISLCHLRLGQVAEAREFAVAARQLSMQVAAANLRDFLAHPAQAALTNGYTRDVTRASPESTAESASSTAASEVEQVATTSTASTEGDYTSCDAAMDTFIAALATNNYALALPCARAALRLFPGVAALAKLLTLRALAASRDGLYDVTMADLTTAALVSSDPQAGMPLRLSTEMLLLL